MFVSLVRNGKCKMTVKAEALSCHHRPANHSPSIAQGNHFLLFTISQTKYKVLPLFSDGLVNPKNKSNEEK
jgi:hypothetical protein